MNSTSRVLAQSNATFMSRVYFWMMLGLAISGMVAFEVSNSPALVNKFILNPALFIGCIVAQFALVLLLAAAINRLSTFIATVSYLTYSVLSGITFAGIFLRYTQQSIAQAFFITAFAFVGLSAFGYVTKRDLGPLGTFAMIGLFGMIAVIFAGILFPSIMSNALQMTINAVGVIVFAGLTAYDTQRIKNYNVTIGSPDLARKGAILGALMLYLDFINLFINLLNLFGDRR